MTDAGKQTVFWVLFAVVMVVNHFWIDRTLAFYFKEISSAVYEPFAVISDLANGAIWFGLSGLGFAYCALRAWRALAGPDKVKWRKHVRSWLFVFSALLAGGIAVNVLKVVIGRYRPRYLFSDDTWGFAPFNFDTSMNSFPSGHAQSICTAMVALTLLFPRIWPVALVTAALVAASRVVLSVHFLSDVLAGAVLGVALTLYLARRFERAGTTLKIA